MRTPQPEQNGPRHALTGKVEPLPRRRPRREPLRGPELVAVTDAVTAPSPAYSGEAEHLDRLIVNAPTGDRDRSEATLVG